MKYKRIIMIISYFLFIYVVNVLPRVNVLNISDILNLIFLNTSSFELYNLEPFNLPYILTYSFLFYIITYLNYSSTNEYVSYVQLITYRMSKYKFYVNRLLVNIWNYVKIIVLMFACILFFSMIDARIQSDGISILKMVVFLLRFANVYIIFNILYDVGSFIGKSTVSHFNALFGTVLMLLIDVVCGTSFITYSNNLRLELFLLLVSTILCGVISVIGWKIYKRKDDIL